MHRFKPLLLGLLLISGCAGEPYRLELPEHHPANADAPPAPLPPPSTSLAEEGPALAPTQDAAPMPGGHAGHAGMHH